MEEDDPVVEEVDVFLTHALTENLYIFQYPVRPAAANYDDIKHLQAKVKPKQQKIELELAVNTQSSNYDSSKGEQIVLNVDGKNPTSTAFFKTGKMDKLTLTSTKAVTSVSRYAVGLLRTGELHLTPLHAIVQLRPCFSYLDLSDSRAKVDLPGTSNQAIEEEEEIKAVTVKFTGPQTEKSRQAKERSYRFMQQKMASEAWINTKFHPSSSPLSTLECNQLFCSRMDHDVSDLPGTCGDYIKALLPPTLAMDASSDMSQNSYGLSLLRSVPLPDQIKTVMCNAKTVEFKQILGFLPGQIDTNLVLRSLQLVAMLVQGCWVVKSELLYPKESCSPLTGTSSEILCRARDFMMWRFTQCRILMRREVLSAVKISNEDCLALLMEMAKPCCSEKGWEFIFPYDKEFVVAYPEVVQRQQMLWDARGQQMKRNLQCIEEKNKILESKGRQRKHRKSTRESQSDDTEESGTDSSHTGYIKPKEQKVGWTAMNGGMDTDPQLACGGARFEIAPTSLRPASELKQELLCFVKDQLISKHCLTLSEMKQSLMRTLMESPPGHPLSTGVTDKLIEETVELAGGQLVNNKWPQNTKPEPIFVFTRFGDTTDKIRDALIDVFSKTARIRSTAFQKKVEDELSETMSEFQTKKILQEYCVIKSGFFYLKGTISPDV